MKRRLLDIDFETRLQALEDSAGYTIPAFGGALYFVRVNAGQTAFEYRSPANVLSDIGAQASGAFLTSVAALGTAADKMIYTTGIDTAAEASITAAGRAILDDADAAAQRATLGSTTVGDAVFIAVDQAAAQAALGVGAGVGDMTKAVYDSNNDGIIAIAQGGTGASTDSGARTALGLAIGTNVQAYSATLTTLASSTAAGLALMDDADASAQRTTLGLAIGTNVQAYDATLGALAAYNTNGILTQTAADTFTGRTITGTASKITVTNGDGVSGNPTITLPDTAVTAGSYTNTNLTVDAQGRITSASNGSAGSSGGWTLITASDPSGAGTVDFTGIGSTYTEYVIVGYLVPSTDARSLYFRIGTGAGPTYQSGATDYTWAFAGTEATGDGTATGYSEGDSVDSQIKLTGATIGIGNASTEGIAFQIHISHPSSAALHKRVHGTIGGSNASSLAVAGAFSGAYKAATAVTAFRLLFSTGNATGHVALFGIQKS